MVVARLALALSAWVCLCAWSSALAEDLSPAARRARLQAIDTVVEQAIARRELPGCVVAIGNRAGDVYTRAYGERTAGEPMTVDTLFDLASLTKPLVTASAVALLVERGVLSLDQPAADVLPELNTSDKRAITIRQLLLHTSGLPSVGPLSLLEAGVTQARARIAAMPLTNAPGRVFDYSDLGYILLGEVIARRTGEPLDRFVARSLFEPLRMRDTHYFVAASDVARTAPTEQRDDAGIRGVVDDPRAYRLGGVAGNAGLFSTANDVARFARMLLGEGELDGVRALRRESVASMAKPVRIGSVQRTLGWDVASPYALGRATTFSRAAFGHGGYTGTSLWIDPEHDLYVVILSNRVHSGPLGTLHPLASSVADLAVRALTAPLASRVVLGIDLLRQEAYARVRGRKVALLTHDAARDSRGKSTLELLSSAPRVTLLSVLTPEHGLSGRHEGKVQDQRYRGLTVHSLFGKTRRPSPQMLSGADLVVIDLVDVGTRFYTYMATVLATLEVAAELDLPVLLLDRPNPIDGVHVEGPLSEPTFVSFVNYHPLPLRHGMTAGELAGFLIAAKGLRTRLSVVRVEGWLRERWSGDEATSRSTWRSPSPNLGTPEQALLYPATALVEGTNVSVGRGTERAFRVVGAPFIDGPELVSALRAEELAGVHVAATRFRPSVGPYAGKLLPGIELTVVDAASFSAARTGLGLIRALRSLFVPAWDSTRLPLMVANRQTLEGLARGLSTRDLEAGWQSELARFVEQRKHSLLY